MDTSDLKTGMLLIDRTGCKGVVMLGTRDGDVIAGDGARAEGMWKPLGNMNEDLTSEYGEYADIVEVWSYGSNMHGASLRMDDRKLLWKRNDTEKLKLNSEYTAVLDRDNGVVKVGCQTFNFFTIRKLYELIYEKRAK